MKNKKITKVENPIGNLIFYINVGNISAEEINTHIQQVIEQMDGFGTECGWSEKALYIPIRTGETRVEVLPCRTISGEELISMQEVLDSKFKEYIAELETIKLDYHDQLNIIRNNYKKSLDIIKNYSPWEKIKWILRKS